MKNITLGPFRVTPEGGLILRDPALRPQLRFAWRGRRCEAELVGGGLRLGALAGSIPFTAEPAGTHRPGVFAALQDLPASLPAGWRLSLLADHRIRLEAGQPMAQPATAIALVSALANFVLTLEPYLSRLEAVGVRRPATASVAASGAASPAGAGSART
ncbi:hypothetical protein M0638_18440 [Roseomonas sp. NAR14]|uniref:Uncharacterized protein n=1 Tax=Roseomonas acroporae TaxID=2937791 RepID=A0A9X2BYS8_9PROT|nr:hypothetical protein [Roseomonas acroporae]MCK8786360.1 hypothetical protein [Roseomonas acroporae]